MSKATMQDVALESGVSLATVSRALTNPDVVSARTRRRIEEAIRKTNYKYPIKKKQNTSRAQPIVPPKGSPVIGVALQASTSTAFAEPIMGIQDACRKFGLSLTVGRTDFNKHYERSLLAKFQKDGVAGIILGGFLLSNETFVREIAQSGTPVCVICEHVPDAEISYVGIDNFKAIYDLTNYLVSLEHSKIGLLCGPFSKSDRPYRRLNGYRAALDEHNIDYDSELVYEAMPTMEEGKIGTRQLLSLQKPPSAIVAAADVFALGALAAIREMGLEVPGDVSIVSIDNIPYSEFSIPPLTTASYPSYDIGYQSVGVIADNLPPKGPSITHKCFDTKIIYRDSAMQYARSD